MNSEWKALADWAQTVHKTGAHLTERARNRSTVTATVDLHFLDDLERLLKLMPEPWNDCDVKPDRENPFSLKSLGVTL